MVSFEPLPDHFAAAGLRELQLAFGHFRAQVDGAAQGRKSMLNSKCADCGSIEHAIFDVNDELIRRDLMEAAFDSCFD